MSKASIEALDARNLKRQLFKLRVKELMKNLERQVYEANCSRSTDHKQ